MRYFYVRHKTLSHLLLLSIAVVFIYLFSLGSPDVFNGVEGWLVVLQTLALSYIASFIFYWVQVYCPEQARKKRIDECVCAYLNHIVNATRQTANMIAERHTGHSPFSMPYTATEWKKLPAFKLDDKVPVISQPPRISYDEHGRLSFQEATIRDVLLHQCVSVENEIDRVMSYYGNNLSTEIISCLENIRSTSLMGPMRAVLTFPVNVIFDADNSDCIFDFYLAGERLERARTKEYGYLAAGKND